MRCEQIPWESGEVVFWDLSFLDPQRPLTDQVEDLKEDLAQVKYARGVLLDIGWYPEFSSEGAFVVRVVRETDWDQPLFLEKHRGVDGLLECIPRAVAAAEVAGAHGGSELQS